MTWGTQTEDFGSLGQGWSLRFYTVNHVEVMLLLLVRGPNIEYQGSHSCLKRSLVPGESGE